MLIRGLLGLTLAAGAFVAPAALATPAIAAAAPASPLARAVPAQPVLGERTVVVTRFSGSPRRLGALEQRLAGGWKVVDRETSDAKGLFRLAARPTSTSTFRVRVAAGPQQGRVSRPVTLSPTPETLGLSLTGSGTMVRASGTASPVRAGRPVELQRLKGERWVLAGTTTETETGAVTVELGHVPQATWTYRWRLRATKDLRETFSETFSYAPQTYVPTAHSLPVLTIDTADAAPIVSKEDYLRATMTLEGSTYPLQVRGRGNSTWTKPKKPLRLKLDTKAPLLGMPTEKDWVLLANFGDLSLVRNSVALDLGARLTAMPWTPRHRPVEVKLNGEYVGAYDLVEQVEASDKRSAKNRLVLEVDETWAGDDPDTIRSPIEKMAVTFKDPDPEDVPQATKDALVADLGTFETALYAPDFEADGHSYTEYVDVNSFVDYFIGSELMKSVDGDCRTNCFFTWAPGQVFRMGPMWDYDHSAGYSSYGPRIGSPEGWWAADPEPEGYNEHHATHWLARMRQDPAFQALSSARWDELKAAGVFTDLVASVDSAAAGLGTIARNNDWERWSGAPHVSGDIHGETSDAQIEFLRDWLQQRVAWMDANL